MKKLIKDIFIGMFIGIANVIPGVSGGTMAVVFGVYDKIIAVSAIDIKRIHKEWQSFLALLIGLCFGLVVFAKLITIVYANYSAQTNFFFIGLIFASIFVVSDNVQFKKARLVPKFLIIFWFGLSFGLMVAVFFLQRRLGMIHNTIQTELTVQLFVWLFAMGVIGAAAMIMPGLSGSFVLLVLGAYQTVMHAIANLYVPLLLPIALGLAVGLLVSGRLIKYLLEHFPSYAYAVIEGLLLGSILYLFPFTCQPLHLRIASALAMLAGYMLVTTFSRINKRR